MIEALNRDPDALDALLRRQNYRLAYWRTAAAELNYRRFFDVATLAGLRVEHPADRRHDPGRRGARGDRRLLRRRGQQAPQEGPPRRSLTGGRMRARVVDVPLPPLPCRQRAIDDLRASCDAGRAGA
jgi:hypothetical protein